MAIHQAGFRWKHGTRGYIMDMRWIMQSCKDYQKPLYSSFTDNSEAFDSIDQSKLRVYLRKVLIPKHHIILRRKTSKWGKKRLLKRMLIAQTGSMSKKWTGNIVFSLYIHIIYTQFMYSEIKRESWPVSENWKNKGKQLVVCRHNLKAGSIKD